MRQGFMDTGADSVPLVRQLLPCVITARMPALVCLQMPDTLPDVRQVNMRRCIIMQNWRTSRGGRLPG